MTDAQYEYLKTYVRQLADLLSLRDWSFIIDRDPPDDDGVIARITPCEGRKVATLEVSADFWGRGPDVIRHSIAHELIHCHHAPATDIIRLDLLRHLSQSTYDMLWAVFKRQTEYMVDGLADAVAPFLPPCEVPDA